MSCARPVALLATVLLASGCEDQEAVPASRTVPVAALQLVALAAVVGGGWALLERRRRARAGAPPPAPVRHRELRWVLAGAAVLAAAAAAGFTLLLVAHGAFGYAEPTNQVFSWDETVAIAWWLVVLGGAFALGELRLAAALLRGSPAAPWVAGAQVALVVLPKVLGALAPA